MLKQVFTVHHTCVAGAHVCSTNSEFSVHMSVHSVVSSSEPEDGNLLRSGQMVVAVMWVIAGVLLVPAFSEEGFDHSLLFRV